MCRRCVRVGSASGGRIDTFPPSTWPHWFLSKKVDVATAMKRQVMTTTTDICWPHPPSIRRLSFTTRAPTRRTPRTTAPAATSKWSTRLPSSDSGRNWAFLFSSPWNSIQSFYKQFKIITSHAPPWPCNPPTPSKIPFVSLNHLCLIFNKFNSWKPSPKNCLFYVNHLTNV